MRNSVLGYRLRKYGFFRYFCNRFAPSWEGNSKRNYNK